jgi:glycosyltransferase involved in cell wall biosynthesis
MFNSDRYLESTVESVIHQTFTEWELVLYDDGSTDRTVAISREFAASDRRITTAGGRHKGVAVARNDGFRHTNAASEYVVFLDSDDTWTPDALEVLVRAVDTHPSCPAAHALARATDMAGHLIDGGELEQHMRRRQRWDNGTLVDVSVASPTQFAAIIVHNWMVTPGTSIIRRSALSLLGNLDPSTSPADDWDLNVRLARLGDIAFVDRVVLNWRRHPDSLANTSRRWRLACFQVRKQSIREPSNTPEQRALALALLGADCKTWRSAAINALKARKPRELAVELAFIVLGHVHYYKLKVLRRAPQP